MKNESCLIITGCITPHENTPFLKVKNSNKREKQYVDSILYYINHTKINRIIYCDNSNSKCPQIIKNTISKSKKEFEWLSFQGDYEKTINQGKGYGEGEIIEYALCNSKLIKESSYILKVTGRVKIKNFDFLYNHMDKNKVYFQRNSRINIDTKFYGMPLNVYKKEFLNAYKSVDDINHKYLEHVFSDICYNSRISVHNFITYPNASGISGSTGESYDMPMLKRIKMTIVNYLRIPYYYLKRC